MLGSVGVIEGSQQMIRKRSHRKLDISNFIMKTYRILEVSIKLFRIRKTVILWNGLMKATVSLLKTNNYFPRKFCLNILNTANSHPLSGSLICMIFIKYANRNKFPFSSIDSSRRVEWIYCLG